MILSSIQQLDLIILVYSSYFIIGTSLTIMKSYCVFVLYSIVNLAGVFKYVFIFPSIKKMVCWLTNICFMRVEATNQERLHPSIRLQQCTASPNQVLQMSVQSC